MFVASDLSGSDKFSNWIPPKLNPKIYTLPSGFLDLIISGTWSGILTVQKRYNHGTEDNPDYTDIFDVMSITTNGCHLIEDYSETVEFRIGFKSGDYVSGTAHVLFEQ